MDASVHIMLAGVTASVSTEQRTRKWLLNQCCVSWCCVIDVCIYYM